MQKLTNNGRRWIRRFVFLALILTGSVTAWAQGSEQELQIAYERELLDSLVVLNYLRPIAHNLQKTNEQLNKAILHLQEGNDLLLLQLKLQKEYYEKLLASERTKRKRSNWLAFGAGALAGSLIPH